MIKDEILLAKIVQAERRAKQKMSFFSFLSGKNIVDDIGLKNRFLW